MARRRGWDGHPPQDDDEAVARIVAAAAALMQETRSGITLASVAESLGVIRQTIYRYFPTADALMGAAAAASVDSVIDELVRHTAGITEPGTAVVEATVAAVRLVPRTPQIGLVLSPPHVRNHVTEVLSERSMQFGYQMIRRLDVDWTRHGYDEEALAELVEYVLRILQSFLVVPGSSTRTEDELRRYLQRWMAPAIRSMIVSG